MCTLYAISEINTIFFYFNASIHIFYPLEDKYSTSNYYVSSISSTSVEAYYTLVSPLHTSMHVSIQELSSRNPALKGIADIDRVHSDYSLECIVTRKLKKNAISDNVHAV